MKHRGNLKILVTLIVLLLLSLLAVIWHLKKPAPSPRQESAQPISAVMQEDSYNSKEENSAKEPLPERMFSSEELLQLARQDLAPFFPTEKLDKMAQLTQQPFLAATVLPLGLTEINAKYPGNDAKSEEAKQAEIKALQKATDSIFQRYRQNYALDKNLAQLSKEEWHRVLALHKKNVSTVGPKGQKPLRRKSISCPPRENQYDSCEAVFYPDKTFSLFFFTQDILLAREDFAAPGTPSIIYHFFPPAPYILRNTPEGKYKAQGVVAHSFVWDKEHQTYSFENRYWENGLLRRRTQRHFDTLFQEDVFYDERGQFARFENAPIANNPAVTRLPQSIVLAPKEYPHDPFSQQKSVFATEGKYRKDISAHPSGRWTGAADGTITLDDGRIFPPAQSFPRAPLYHQLYAIVPFTQSSSAQNAPELL